MKTYTVEIVEDVTATILVKVQARNKQEAAQMARDAWVVNGEGEMSEVVNDRTTAIDGIVFETTDEV